MTQLGITGSLLKAVFSTNPVESMIEIVREHAAKVKRWLDGEMALRWTAAGMVCAQAQFRRAKGYRQLPELARRLEAIITNDYDGWDILANSDSVRSSGNCSSSPASRTEISTDSSSASQWARIVASSRSTNRR